MNILITGSRGFIGSCLSAIALDRWDKHNVIGLDDLSRGLNNVQSLERIKFIPHDCREGIKDILDEQYEINIKGMRPQYFSVNPKVDVVVHLAAGTGSLSRPLSELMELNVEMTKKIYHDALEHGAKVFVFPTTSLVEGVPDAPYVDSKQRAMDWLVAQNDNIQILPLQFYNVTGAYNNFTEHRKLEVHIIPIMLECYMNNKPFVINGDDYDTIDGTPGRDYSNVVDLCNFILDVSKDLIYTPMKITKPIKLGTGQTTTALQLIKMFNEFMEPKFGRKLEYQIGPRRAYDCGWLRCDQPYLHIYTGGPTTIKDSLEHELEALLKVVYNVQ